MLPNPEDGAFRPGASEGSRVGRLLLDFVVTVVNATAVELAAAAVELPAAAVELAAASVGLAVAVELELPAAVVELELASCCCG